MRARSLDLQTAARARGPWLAVAAAAGVAAVVGYWALIEPDRPTLPPMPGPILVQAQPPAPTIGPSLAPSTETAPRRPRGSHRLVAPAPRNDEPEALPPPPEVLVPPGQAAALAHLASLVASGALEPPSLLLRSEELPAPLPDPDELRLPSLRVEPLALAGSELGPVTAEP